jgi:hypothetical protein
MIANLFDNENSAFGPSFRFHKSYNFNSTTSGNELGYIDFRGTNPSLSTVRGAYIIAKQNGDASGNVPTDLEFYTFTSTSGASRMIITNDGKVGIGTTMPSAPLTVAGTIICGSTTDGVLRLGNQGGDFFIESALSTSSGYGNKLHFSNWNNNKTTMVLNTSTQQVGINTTNPLYTLDVSGTLYVSDYISSGTIYSNLISSNNISSGIGSFSNYLSTNKINMNSGQVVGLSTINGLAWPPVDDALWSSNSNDIYNDNTGNVGIGTSTPTVKLTVVGSGLFGSTTNGVLRLTNAFGNSYIESGSSINSGAGNTLHFSNYNNAATTMVVNTYNQRVGINTTGPSYALDVSGVLNLQSGTATDASVDLANRDFTYIRLDQGGTPGTFAYLRNIGAPLAMHVSLDIHDATDPNFSVRSVNNSGTDIISTLMNVDKFGTITANNYTSKSDSVGLAAVGAGATSGVVFTATKVGFLNIIVASDLKVNGNFYAYNYAIYYNGSSSQYEVYSLGPGFTSGGITVNATNGATGVTFTITNASGIIQTFNYSFSYTNALNIN